MGKYKRSNTRNIINREIRAKSVRCINSNNENLGIISTYKALNIAMEDDLDLVQVSPYKKNAVPTCKIMDYKKYKYELSKKEKLQAKKQRETAIKIKELKFRPVTSLNDMKIKAKKAAEFIENGYKLKVSIVFKKRREASHKELAIGKLYDFLDLVNNSVVLENQIIEFSNAPAPDQNYKSLSVFLVKNKKRLEKAS